MPETNQHPNPNPSQPLPVTTERSRDVEPSYQRGVRETEAYLLEWGMKKWKVPLRTWNGRSAVKDAREEFISGLRYLEQEAMERADLEAELAAAQQRIAELEARATAPAGWPSDEVVAAAIDDYAADISTFGGAGVAAAVQRLYAPLRERLARYEAATEDTSENRAAVLTAYFGTYTPEDLDRTPGKCAAKVLAHLRRVAQGEAQL